MTTCVDRTTSSTEACLVISPTSTPTSCDSHFFHIASPLSSQTMMLQNVVATIALLIHRNLLGCLCMAPYPQTECRIAASNSLVSGSDGRTPGASCGKQTDCLATSDSVVGQASIQASECMLAQGCIKMHPSRHLLTNCCAYESGCHISCAQGFGASIDWDQMSPPSTYYQQYQMPTLGDRES